MENYRGRSTDEIMIASLWKPRLSTFFPSGRGEVRGCNEGSEIARNSALDKINSVVFTQFRYRALTLTDAMVSAVPLPSDGRGHGLVCFVSHPAFDDVS
jgi:hypothetical protein